MLSPPSLQVECVWRSAIVGERDGPGRAGGERAKHAGAAEEVLPIGARRLDLGALAARLDGLLDRRALPRLEVLEDDPLGRGADVGDLPELVTLDELLERLLERENGARGPLVGEPAVLRRVNECDVVERPRDLHVDVAEHDEPPTDLTPAPRLGQFGVRPLFGRKGV